MKHERPTDDFKLLYFDSLLNSNIYTRPRVFSNNLLATLPAVNGISTIVIGTPENTRRTSQNWVVTLIHEHFHQLQYTNENYFTNVDALNLAGDDKSGMWMLNYDFPYENEIISNQYKSLVQSAKVALMNFYFQESDSLIKKYFSEREKFKSLLKEDDYKYFSFQIWQEGIARYTEVKIVECIKNGYNFSEAFNTLDDIVPEDSFFVSIYQELLRRADNQNLSTDKRNCFYTLGALEGLLADAINQDWKDQYFKEMFFVEKYLK
jgi:Zn ribbon nucleic-acid-binding protein